MRVAAKRKKIGNFEAQIRDLHPRIDLGRWVSKPYVEIFSPPRGGGTLRFQNCYPTFWFWVECKWSQVDPSRFCEKTEFSNSCFNSVYMLPMSAYKHSIDVEFNSLSNDTIHNTIGDDLMKPQRKSWFSRSKKVEYSSFDPLPNDLQISNPEIRVLHPEIR